MQATYTLWLLNDVDNNGRDSQCWFHHPDIPNAFQETKNGDFAQGELKRIRKCNPNRKYELRVNLVGALQ